jgi:hypothetical protein
MLSRSHSGLGHQGARQPGGGTGVNGPRNLPHFWASKIPQFGGGDRCLRSWAGGVPRARPPSRPDQTESATTHTQVMAKRGQPLNHGDDCGDLGGVARPHFRAHRPTVAVDHHRQDHLPKVRPEPCSSICPPAPSKYRLVEAGEQIAAVIEQLLLDHIPQAARCKWRAAVLLLFP